MAEHSYFAPSGASVWTACPGSLRLKQPELDDSDNTIREEGTACHELAAARLTGQPEPTVASNGVAIDDDMREATKLYCKEVNSVTLEPTVEARTPCRAVHPECFGTVDAYAIAADTLYIWDLKYGFGYVDAFQNMQLLCYASGLMRPGVERIVLTIVQPRPYAAVRRWGLSAEQMAGWTDKLAEAATLAGQPDAPVRSGPHCKNCSARFDCPAATRAGLDLYETVATARMQNSSPADLAAFLTVVDRAAEQIKYLQTGVSEQLKHLLKSGQSVPGYKLVGKKGRLGWSAAADEVLLLGELMGVDLSKPPEPVTPTQAGKLGLPESLVDSYADRKPAGLELVRVTEKSIAKTFDDSNLT